jgi:ubiquinone/menaquinone biosynthesis C-methylase UbiE
VGKDFMKSNQTNNHYENEHVFLKEREKVWKIMCTHLQKYISPKAVILDIGAGYCDFINNIKGKEKHALDISDAMLKHARKGIIKHKQKSTDLEEFKSEYFDIIFASNIFEHLTRKELQLTLREVYKILKKGGKLLIIQPNFKYGYKEYFDDSTHMNIYTHISMSEVLRSNSFFVERVYPRFLPITMKSRFKKLYFLLSIYLYLPIKPFAKQFFIIARKTKIN